MAPIALESEDHSRDAAFNKVMHGKSVDSKGFRSMLNKDHTAHQAATEEYFKHWDNKSAGAETVEIREVNAERSAKCSQTAANSSIRHGRQNMPLLPGTIITSPRISTNMAGGAHSISAVSLMVKASTKLLLDTNTIWRT